MHWPRRRCDVAAIGVSEENACRPSWMFVRVEEPRAVKNRCHPDLVAADRAGEVERALAAGARRIGDFDESGARWTTLADPEGNEFDIVESP